MSQIVLIHGIAQEQESADTLELRWLPALAGGVRNAGRDDLADRLWRGAKPGDVETRMAFYGDLFLDPERQNSSLGVEDLTQQQQELAETLAQEWLRRAEERAALPEDRQQARAVLRANDPQAGTKQGWKARARPFLNGLAKLHWFAPKGMKVAKLGNRSLTQVTRYLSEKTVHEEVQRRIAAHVGPETVAIIGHSLGSVAAFQAASRLQHDLPLLLTLGSPLGLRSVVYDVLPEPKKVPSRVQKWVNLADKDDLVAAEPDLGRMFIDGSGALDSNWALDNGSEPHRAEHYLTKRTVGAAVATVIEN